MVLLTLRPLTYLARDESGELFLCSDDYELFDYIQDYLVEDCNIIPNYYQNNRTDGKELYKMIFSEEQDASDLARILSELDKQELDRIYSLNNPRK